MGRTVSTPERISKKLYPKRMCVIATEDSKHGAYAYFTALKTHFNDRFIVGIAEILPSKGGRSAPKHVLNKIRPYGFDPAYDTCWVVIDVDSWGENAISKVVTECELKKGFYTAISNNCFEIWLLYHKHGFNKTFRRSVDCKSDGERYLNGIGGIETLITNANMSVAINKAKSLPSAAENWPSSQGSHIYKLIEYLRGE